MFGSQRQLHVHTQYMVERLAKGVMSWRVVTVKNKLIVCDPIAAGLFVPVYHRTVMIFINALK